MEGTNTSIRSGTLRTIRAAHNAAWERGGGREGGRGKEGEGGREREGGRGREGEGRREEG